MPRRVRRPGTPIVVVPQDEAATHATGHPSHANRRPGDPTPAAMIDRLLRVDQAGEYGAVRIYQGQLAVLGDRHPKAPVIAAMLRQEEEHLATLDQLVAGRGARPSALQPLWHVAGFALGAGTALLGDKAAMACTTAVEEVIDDHYRDQYDRLGDDELPLKALLHRLRDDERHHRDIGLDHGAEEAPAYPLLSEAIKSGTRLAIWLAERV